MRFGMGYGAWTNGGRHGGMPGLHPGHRRRGGRMFEGSDLRLVFLSLIAHAPRHGYELIRQVEEMTGGGYVPSPGVVYPTLTLLAETGMIEEQSSSGVKKRFAATTEGAAHLAENRAGVDALMARLRALASAQAGSADAAPVRRAMGNLHQVLHDRLDHSDAGHETLHQVADLIDEAARKIERLA